MNIFLICPVRNVSPEYDDGIAAWVSSVEREGNRVHWPRRDTDQDDRTGLQICADNLAALQEADLVCVIWDGESQGVLFDLGMAFALHKTVRTIVGYMPAATNGKSFQNMVYAWEEGDAIYGHRSKRYASH